MAALVTGFDLHCLIVLVPGVFRGIDDSPVREWRQCRIIGKRTRPRLIQVLAYVQAIRVHADVAHPQGRIEGKFSFYGDVPLRGLRVAIAWVGSLFKSSAANLYELAR